MRCTEAQSGEKIAGDILHIVVHIPLTGRDKLVMQPHHITDRPHQLNACIIVEIAHLVTAAFEFFHVRRGNAHHIGQLVHGFFALVKNTFEFVYAVQRFCHLIGGFRVVFPRMVIEVFQLFFLVANRMQSSFVCDNLNIHAGINGKIKLLFLIVKNLTGWEIQFTDHIGNRKVRDVAFRILGFHVQIPLFFLNQTAGRLDKIVPLNQRITLTLFERQRKLKIFIGRAGPAVDMLQQIAEIILI